MNSHEFESFDFLTGIESSAHGISRVLPEHCIKLTKSNLSQLDFDVKSQTQNENLRIKANKSSRNLRSPKNSENVRQRVSNL